MIEKDGMNQQLTPEKRKQLEKLGAKFLAKSLWNGMQHGLMAVLMNFILVMGVSIYFDGSEMMNLLGCVMIGYFILKRMLSTFHRDTAKFKQAAQEIIKQ